MAVKSFLMAVKSFLMAVKSFLMAVKRNTEGGPRGRLPMFFTCFFSLVACHALFFELGPAMSERRRAQRSLEQQMTSHENIVRDIDTKRRALDSLLNDPQSIEDALDQKGMLPPILERR